jgi:hypothetical protein
MKKKASEALGETRTPHVALSLPALRRTNNEERTLIDVGCYGIVGSWPSPLSPGICGKREPRKRTPPHGNDARGENKDNAEEAPINEKIPYLK